MIYMSSRVEKDSEIARNGRIIAVTRAILAEAHFAPPLHVGTKKVRNERRWRFRIALTLQWTKLKHVAA